MEVYLVVSTETTVSRTNAKPVYPVQVFSSLLSSAQEFICKSLLLHKHAGALCINYNCSHTLLEKTLFPRMIVLLSFLTCHFSAFVLNFIKYYLRTEIIKARLHRKRVLADTCLFKLSNSDLHVRRCTWHKPRGGHLIQNSKRKNFIWITDWT